MQRLQDRVAVVTGAGSGIGLASARRLAAEGAVVVAVDIDEAAGKAAAAEIGGHVHRRRRGRRGRRRSGCIETSRTGYGRIDVAFNNAGISPPEDDSILTTGLDAWRRVQEVNLTSVYLCCKYVIPYMQRQGKGSIINTASFVAVLGAATSQISYTASKGGVLSMTRELGVQFAREGIRVNALCPGPVNTPAAARAVRQGPRAGGPAAGARPDRPVRRAGGDRRRGRLPGQRRRLVHHRVAVPGRRRHLRRLRDTVVTRRAGRGGPSDGRRGPGAPLIGISAYGEQARWGVWEMAGHGAAAALRGPRRGGRRDPGAAAAGAGHRGRARPGWTAWCCRAAATSTRPATARSPRRRPRRCARTGTPPSSRCSHAALARRLPVLGICRGMQVINVALGGSLHQHLPDVVGHDEHAPAGGVRRARGAGWRPAAGWPRSWATPTSMPIIHRRRPTITRRVDRLGDGLTATAWAADGTIEAFEPDDAGPVRGGRAVASRGRRRPEPVRRARRGRPSPLRPSPSVTRPMVSARPAG